MKDRKITIRVTEEMAQQIEALSETLKMDAEDRRHLRGGRTSMSAVIAACVADKFRQSQQRHGRLTILGAGSKQGRRTLLRVRCDCGTEKEIQRANLKRTKSCGCFRDDKNRETMRANPDKFIGAQLRHGHMSGGPSPTWHSWHSMWQRCTNPKRSNYKYYGGRGIGVCERW